MLRTVLLGLGLFVWSLSWQASAWATIINAASASLTDVNTAIGTAVSGDTVVVPAGSATWSSTLSIGKAITLQGNGIGSTVITEGGGADLIQVSGIVSGAQNTLMRITGFTFNKTTGSAIQLNGPHFKMRVDHNAFTRGDRTIRPQGFLYGVVDHNTFLNANIAVGVVGDNDTSWDRPQEMGTGNSFFIEDNTFTQNNSAPFELNEFIYHEWGMRTVIRYNLFDCSAYTTFDTTPFDAHGNVGRYPGQVRGSPTIEIYNNTWLAHHGYRILYLRGGSYLIHDNTLTLANGTIDFISFTDEDTWHTGGSFQPNDTVWPAEDQIMNSYIWNNSLTAGVTLVGIAHAEDVAFIQSGRDYILHAPQSSGGKETYTSRAGGDMTFSSSGANAYYPYTPYTYPHPLVGTATPSIKASGGFRKSGGVQLK